MRSTHTRPVGHILERSRSLRLHFPLIRQRLSAVNLHTKLRRIPWIHGLLNGRLHQDWLGPNRQNHRQRRHRAGRPTDEHVIRTRRPASIRRIAICHRNLERRGLCPHRIRPLHQLHPVLTPLVAQCRSAVFWCACSHNRKAHRFASAHRLRKWRRCDLHWLGHFHHRRSTRFMSRNVRHIHVVGSAVRKRRFLHRIRRRSPARDRLTRAVLRLKVPLVGERIVFGFRASRLHKQREGRVNLDRSALWLLDNCRRLVDLQRHRITQRCSKRVIHRHIISSLTCRLILGRRIRGIREHSQFRRRFSRDRHPVLAPLIREIKSLGHHAKYRRVSWIDHLRHWLRGDHV